MASIISNVVLHTRMSQHVDSTASLLAFQPNVSILLAITLYSVSLYPYKFKITFFFWYLLIPI